MAFRKKAGSILAYNPDILIIPECEHPDKLKFNGSIPIPTDMLWFGTNQNKGLGIFSYSECRFKLIKTHNPLFKMIIPIAVSGGSSKFTLYAVWANNPGDMLNRFGKHFNIMIRTWQVREQCLSVILIVTPFGIESIEKAITPML
jgi:hypothetical protein